MIARRWWRTHVIPALGRQRLAISEFEASLVYMVSSRTAKDPQRNSLERLKKKKKRRRKKKICLNCLCDNKGGHLIQKMKKQVSWGN